MRTQPHPNKSISQHSFTLAARPKAELLARSIAVLMLISATSCSSDDKGETTNNVTGGTGAIGGGGAGGTTGGVGGTVGGVGGTMGGVGGTVGGAAGMVGGVGGTTGGTAGTTAGSAGTTAGTAGVGGTAGMDPDSGVSGMGGAGGGGGGDTTCCAGGDCICRGPNPTDLVTTEGEFNYESYAQGVGCVYYPTDAEPPFAAVTISDGFGGSGGCGAFAQTSGWGPFYASHGIVVMIVDTTGNDQPRTRGTKLLGGIEALKGENEDSASPLFGKLAGRYGTSGFSMGGGGTTFAAADNSELLSSVGLMAWTPTGNGVTVPTLFICGASDGLAVCGSHSEPAYAAMPDTTDKMLAFVSASHVGQPSAGGNMSGGFALAFQKVYLEGDERWRPILLGIEYDQTNIE